MQISQQTEVVERNSRGTRWFHAATYLTVLILLATGWWFVIDGYRTNSPLGRLFGVRDVWIHEVTGLLMAAVVGLWLLRGARGLRTFIRETLRFRREDPQWLLSWPRAAFTGRFGRHDGHFDPGQRLANVVMVLTLVVLLLTGLGMVFLSLSPPYGDWLVDAHRWATFLTTPVILGHIVVASGVLPGYRGVWRSMHLGGRLPIEVARRLWPRWTDEAGKNSSPER